MLRLAWISVKRFRKIYLTQSAITLFILMFVSSPIVIAAYGAREQLNIQLNEQDPDFFVGSSFTSNISSDDIPLLFEAVDKWTDIEWEPYINKSGVVLIFTYPENDSFISLGLELEAKNESLQKSVALNDTDSRFDLGLVEVVESLPFGLTAIIAREDFMTIGLDWDFLLQNSTTIRIQYYANFNLGSFWSYDEYVRISDKIESSFKFFLANTKISDLHDAVSFHLSESSDIFDKLFGSLMLFLFLISFVSSIWIVKIVNERNHERLKSSLESAFNRGLTAKQFKALSVTIPIVFDFTSLVIVILQISLLNVHANLTNLIGILILTFSYITYQRYSVSSSKKGVNVMSYVLSIFTAIPLLYLIGTTFSLLIPWAYLQLGYSSLYLLIYYSGTIIATEFMVKIIDKYHARYEGLDKLLTKVYSFNGTKIRDLSHSLTITLWCVVLITGIVATYNTNYLSQEEFVYPSDIRVVGAFNQTEISEINNWVETRAVLPLSVIDAKYFVDYQLYLTNFTIIENEFMNLLELARLKNLESSVVYVSTQLADSLNINDGDKISLPVAANGSFSIYELKTVEVITSFPLVIDSKAPFAVASFSLDYTNYTIADELHITLNNASAIDFTNKLESSSTDPVWVEENMRSNVYSGFLNLYATLILVLLSAQIVLAVRDYLEETGDDLRKLISRGLSRRQISGFGAREFSILSFSQLVVGLSTSLIFMKAHTKSVIFNDSFSFRPILDVSTGIALATLALLGIIAAFLVNLRIVYDGFGK